jgi:hypothetical protein
VDLSRLLGQAAMLTVSVVVVTAFLLAVAYGLARLTVHLMDHVDGEITQNQSTVQLELGPAGPMARNVIDVTTPARQLADGPA